ncbi:MAG: hypothetical protein ACO1OB_17240 [Archangium sp.]
MRFAVILLALAASGCRHAFPLPYSASQLRVDAAEEWSGEALVHYLKQDDADPAVCDVRTEVLPRQDETLVDPFVASLEDNELELPTWKECASRFVKTMEAEPRELFLERLAHAVWWLLNQDDPAGRLQTIQDVLIKRPREDSPALALLLERLLTRKNEKFELDVSRTFESMLTTLELGRGQLNGKPVTLDVIDETQDERLIFRMSKRLPSLELREAARVRLVRLRIARSPWDEVKNRAAEVERSVLTTGRWPQSTAGMTLQQTTQVPLELPVELVVQQNPQAQYGKIVVKGTNARTHPNLKLRGVVTFDVGWSRPLNVCAPPDELEVDPCIEARDLELNLLEVSLDEDGAIWMATALPMSRVVDLARANEGLVMSLRLAGQLVTTLRIPIEFADPPSLRFTGAPGEPGPALNVKAEVLSNAVIFLATAANGVSKYAVWPRTARNDFEVASAGGDGVNGIPGARGAKGAAGVAGGAATCPSMAGRSGSPGDRGGPGGDGTDGGNGGDGGPVTVEVRCAEDVDCAAGLELIRVLVHSRAGAAGEGGAAGPGGFGGNGGAGGAGASCIVNGAMLSLENGFNGARGADGLPGKEGKDGEPGQEGTVVVKPAAN